jgi:CRP-like cAMP-binding protein
MCRGQVFGELALIGKCLRAARIVAHTTCHVVVVKKYIYEKLIEKFMLRKRQANNEFFLGLGIFRSWTTSRLFALQE